MTQSGTNRAEIEMIEEKGQQSVQDVDSQGSVEEGREQNYIFSQADLDKVDSLKRKAITTPAIFLLATSFFAFAAKKCNLRRILANPLKNESSMSKNDKYWRFATYNSIIMGTVGLTTALYFRS